MHDDEEPVPAPMREAAAERGHLRDATALAVLPNESLLLDVFCMTFNSANDVKIDCYCQAMR